MKKKLISLLTAFSMTLMMFGTPNINAADNAHTSHKVCVGSSCTDSSHTEISDWIAISNASGFSNLETGKHYYLTQDITLGNAADWNTNSIQSAITIGSGKNVAICLNGHTISIQIQNGVQARIFSIKDGGSLTLCDCSSGKTGTLTGGNVAANSGGSVFMSDGEFTMYGGTISGNTAGNGGGVYVNGGTFTMNGDGTISDNQASSGGGGVYVTATNGKFTMNGGTISGNKATGNGGGVYIYTNGTFTMSGGEISGNEGSYGGGVYENSSNAEFTMTGGTISNNTATNNNGGGVRVANGTFTINGNVDISGNTKGDGTTASNVNLSSNNKITIGNNFSTNSKIGVNTAETPTCTKFVDVTTFAEGVEKKDISASFTADISGQSIVYNDGKVQLKGAHTATKTEATDATCTVDGNSDYWKCSVCEKYFSDEACTTEIEETETVINAKGHKLEQVPASDPTYTEAGNIEYWHCSVCGKNFNDKNGTKELTTEKITIPATGYTGNCGSSGDKGDNATWTYDETTKTLTITGSGNMDNWTDENPAPWAEIAGKIEKVVVDDGITSIGNNAFEGCTGLTDVTIPNTVTDIGSGAFEGCTSLTKVTIPENVEKIGDSAFSGTGLTNVTIPESVTDIGDNAFAGCTSLKEVEFKGETPPTMGNDVFDGAANLDKITVPEGKEDDYKAGNALPDDKITDGTPDNTGSCGENATWTYDEATNTLTIKGSGDMTNWTDGTKTPWADVAKDIKNVVIEDGITSIGNNAFEGCENLTDVTIPDTVTDIGDNAFKGTGLTDVTIPDSVTEIGNGAFADCDNLENITFDGTTPPALGDGAIGNDVSITVPEGSEDDYKTAEGFDSVADNITDGTTDNPDSCGENAKWTYDETTKTLTITGSGDMTDWTDGSKTPWADVADKIENVVIDDGITSIGDNAFEDCTKLESVVIPDSVTDIGDNAIPADVPQIKYSVTDDGKVIIENISGVDDGENVEIPNNIGGKPVVGVDENVQDKVTVKGHTDDDHTGGTATCQQKAVCAICGEEYVELGDHALNPTAAKDATCTEDGNDAYWTCSVCAKMFSNANGTAEITEVNTYPATGHTYLEAWDGDETYHWHNADCGHDSISEKEVHTWDEGIVETEPTIEAEGVKIYTCKVCSKTKTESIPQLAHTHTYSDEWTSDETNHWHEATCGHDNISEVAAHTEDNGRVTTPPTTETEGVKTYACTVCGYVMRTASIPQLDENHVHDFSTYWIHDGMSHWHECDCGEKADFSEHISNGGVVTVEPTETSIGTMKYSCTVCGYVIRTEEIPALDPVIPDHSHSFGDKWEYDPTHHWHKCECGEKSDLAEHIPSGWIVETPAATDKEGVQIKVCTVCGIELDRKPIANKVQDTAGTKTEFVPDNNLLDKVLTDEDKADINDNGSSYEVILEVTAKPTDVENELISETLKPNGKLGMCVDLSLFKVKDGNMAAKYPVYETNAPIGITLTIPDSIYAPDRNYFVVRVHDNKAENIGGTYDRANRTLTFYTDKFSIYAIAYTASNVTPTRPSTPSIPSTPSGGGTASVSPSVSVVTPTVTETTEKTEDEVISDTPYVDDVSSAAGINETDDNSQSPLYMIVIIIAIAVVGFSSIIIVKRFAKKKRC